MHTIRTWARPLTKDWSRSMKIVNLPTKGRAPTVSDGGLLCGACLQGGNEGRGGVCPARSPGVARAPHVVVRQQPQQAQQPREDAAGEGGQACGGPCSLVRQREESLPSEHAVLTHPPGCVVRGAPVAPDQIPLHDGQGHSFQRKAGDDAEHLTPRSAGESTRTWKSQTARTRAA